MPIFTKAFPFDQPRAVKILHILNGEGTTGKFRLVGRPPDKPLVRIPLSKPTHPA
ncbi:MAG: hypothetical protein H7Z75_03600 [Ferruginibacter sp.]|nr:hypothetical protein [Cytophagales bacterium]